MGILILFIICVIAGGIWGSADDETFAGLGLGVIAGVIIGAIFIATAPQVELNTTEEFQYNIEGLELQSKIEQNIDGAFILGCGYIDGETSEINSYVLFSISDYGKKLETLSIDDNVYIKETNEVEPNVTHVCKDYETKGKFWKWFIGGTGTYKSTEAIIITVPEDTIKIEYNVEV